jgi:CBS domain containing-hemolysin-like protein
MEETLVLRLVLFFVLLGLSALFSGAEVALFSLTPVQVEMLEEKHGRSGKLVARLLASGRKLLVTIYLGNELLNVAIAAVSTIIAIHFFGGHGVAAAIGIGTFMLLVFGDISPKTYALKHAESYSLAVARPLYLFSRIIYPLQVVITWMTDILISLTGKPDEDEKTQITEEEIKSVLDHGEHNGVIKSDEKEMIFNIFELGDTVVTDIMTPRTEIFSLSAEEGVEAVVRRAILSNHSRIPIYEKDPDHIIGILFAKDLLAPDIEKSVEKIEDLLHECYFVPSTKKIDELLREFQKTARHMAIILDEYGGVDGMVTLDDILEEVVGEPPDSKNIVEIRKVNEGHYHIPGRLVLEDFNNYFKTTFAHEEIDTIGGFVFHLFGRMPRWGESVTSEGVTFSVRKLKGGSIWQLSVKVSPDSRIREGASGDEFDPDGNGGDNG